MDLNEVYDKIKDSTQENYRIATEQETIKAIIKIYNGVWKNYKDYFSDYLKLREDYMYQEYDSNKCLLSIRILPLVLNERQFEFIKGLKEQL